MGQTTKLGLALLLLAAVVTLAMAPASGSVPPDIKKGAKLAWLQTARATNSILQGNLIVSDRHFEARYPSASGFSTFLVDVPPDGSVARKSATKR